jgi:hypothetical protein
MIDIADPGNEVFDGLRGIARGRLVIQLVHCLRSKSRPSGCSQDYHSLRTIKSYQPSQVATRRLRGAANKLCP